VVSVEAAVAEEVWAGGGLGAAALDFLIIFSGVLTGCCVGEGGEARGLV
jgi:hypothetical protein